MPTHNAPSGYRLLTSACTPALSPLGSDHVRSTVDLMAPAGPSGHRELESGLRPESLMGATGDVAPPVAGSSGVRYVRDTMGAALKKLGPIV